MNPITIFFAADVGYYQHLCVLLASILENNRRHRFSFYVLTDNDDSPENEKILSLKNSYDNFDLCFNKIDDDRVRLNLTIDYISTQTYYRYLIPELFPDLDRALYLDGDMIVVGDLEELWTTDLDGYYAAGVDDLYIRQIGYKPQIGFDQDELYVNAGCLLMNLKKMREDNITERLIDNSLQWAESIRFQDQDVINMTLRGNIKPIEKRYNWCTVDSHAPFETANEPPSIVISHFTGKSKPWSIDGRCNHKSCYEYFKYLRKTPYRSFIRRYRSKRFFMWTIPWTCMSILKIFSPKRIVRLFQRLRAL